MRRFFIDPSSISKDSILISGSEAKHIRTVLRLKAGDKITLYDGTGMEYLSEINKFTSNGVESAIISRYSILSESTPEIIAAVGFLKEKKLESLIPSLSELGVSKLIPFFSEHCVSKPESNRIVNRLSRWERIAQESIKQCGRSIAMKIEVPVGFKQALDIGIHCEQKILFWEQESSTGSLEESCVQQPSNIFVMTGPEGGFSQKEVEAAKECGFITASLGPRILKAETAAIAACTIVQYVFGDMHRKKRNS